MSVSNKISDKGLSIHGQEKRSANRFTRFWEIAAVTVFPTFLTVLIFSVFIVQWNQDALYLEKVKTGEIILNHFVNNATIPLLEDDTLTLNTFIKETKNMEEFLYAVVVDSKNIIKAHTDSVQIGAAFKELENAEEITKNGNITQAKYILPPGIHVLNLSKPVIYMNKIVGAVHVGLSLDFIKAMIQKETFSLIRKIFFWGLSALMLAMGAAIFLSRRLNRSLSRPLLVEPITGQGQQPHGGAFPKKTLDSFIKTENTEKLPLVTRNHVTVIFAGIKGFKAYANTKVVEEVMDDLNEYFTIATKCILEHGGYIDKFLGDSVVGVFGDSPLHTDHTARAVNSAVAMLKSLQNASKNGNQLLGKVGIGISSGVVLSGYIGTADFKEYSSIGESFQEAYLQHVMAGPGEIVLSKDVYLTVKSFVAAEPLPPREIMQKTGPWENFRLRDIQ